MALHISYQCICSGCETGCGTGRERRAMENKINHVEGFYKISHRKEVTLLHKFLVKKNSNNELEMKKHMIFSVSLECLVFNKILHDVVSVSEK